MQSFIIFRNGWDVRYGSELVSRNSRTRRTIISILAVLSLIIPHGALFSQSSQTIGDLKKLTLEELMSIEVTTVSRQAEKLSEAASAVQVITADAIWRSGAVSLAEALRLATNLHVAQSNSHDWAITARGFNGAPLGNSTLANKLLVMIDGRSIYTPLFGGVFWDVQHVLLEDIDQIEVVSGPGGTLWGANAVNGVINIVTRSARATQGGYVSGGAGSLLQDFGAVRYGGGFGENTFYRGYLQRLDQRNTKLRTGLEAEDDWQITQAGFRVDHFPSDKNTVTVQGDYYVGDIDVSPSTSVNGQNVLGRWTHSFSDHSDLTVQIYLDRTWRKLPEAAFSEDLKTYDLDLQHRMNVGARHHVLWGAGFRLMQDDLTNTPSISFVRPRRNMHVFNVFVQDKIRLLAEHLELTVGSKFEHNVYSGLEVQPGVRMAWTPAEQHTVWAAASRAIHAPSRLDTDISFPVIGDREFESEKVDAYALGYRVRPLFELSLSVAAFYNKYHDVRSLDFLPEQSEFTFLNGHHGASWGFELSGSLQALDWWRLRGGYTYFAKDLESENATTVAGADRLEALDPSHQLLIQSMMDLPAHIQLDIIARYADTLPAREISTVTPPVSAYFEIDARFAWQFRGVEISVVGRNLLHEQHQEFGTEIPRNVYGKIAWRF